MGPRNSVMNLLQGCDKVPFSTNRSAWDSLHERRTYTVTTHTIARICVGPSLYSSDNSANLVGIYPVILHTRSP